MDSENGPSKDRGAAALRQGILEQMQENMEADLKESEESEASALADFGGLLAAKNKEIASATSGRSNHKLQRSSSISFVRFRFSSD